MAANLNIVGACERIRKEAEDMAGENYAFNLKRPTGAIDFLTSPDNGIEIDSSLISYNSGKKAAKLHVFYDQRTKECNISTNCNFNICDDGTTPVRKEVDFTINDCIKTPVREYTNNDMIALCMDRGEFIRKRAASDLRAAVEKLDSGILAKLDDEIGVNRRFDGTTASAGAYTNITLLSDIGGQTIPRDDNFADLMLDYAQNQLNGVPAIIGSGNIQKYFKLHGWACCNSATPYGDADLDGAEARFYLDTATNAVLNGAARFLMIAPGILKFMTFNENADINIEDDSVAHTVIADPNGYPFKWNMDILWVACDKTWKVQFSLLWGLFNVMRPDSFAASGEESSPNVSPDCGDYLDNMLGVFGYNGIKA